MSEEQMPLDEQMPLVSIIIPAKNEGDYLKQTIESAFQVKTDYPFEIIVVDDGSTDNCSDFLKFESYAKPVKLVRSYGLGSANARNLGAENADGDYFIFCDAHVCFEDLWIDRLLDPIRSGQADAVNPGIADTANPNNVGYGYHWTEELEPRWNPQPQSLTVSSHLAGGCLAISRNVFFDIRGFDRGFRVWGREDEEISLKLWLFGYKCCIIPEVKILHVFRPEAPPFIISWDDVNYNFLRMAYSHFNEDRIQKCLSLMKNSKPLKIMSLLLSSDILDQRKAYLARRKYDDDWFMDQFGIKF